MIAQLLAVACSGDRAVLARIGGALGDAARAAGDELAELPGKDRRKLRIKVAAAARTSVPAGIRGVHASWIEAGLVGLPARAREAIARGDDDDPVDVWLVRWALAEIPPLPAVTTTTAPPCSLDDALRMPGERLARWLAEVGADQLAHALQRAGVAAIAAIASRVVGERLAIASRRIELAPRAGALGPTRAAIKRCRGAVDQLSTRRPSHAATVASDDAHTVARLARGAPGADGHAPTVIADAADARTMARSERAAVAAPDDDLLLRIGARAIAPHVDAVSRRQLAVRLPRPLGLAVLAELRAHAATPLASSPSWAALAAAW